MCPEKKEEEEKKDAGSWLACSFTTIFYFLFFTLFLPDHNSLHVINRPLGPHVHLSFSIRPTHSSPPRTMTIFYPKTREQRCYSQSVTMMLEQGLQNIAKVSVFTFL